MKLRYFLLASIMITIISCSKNGGSGLSIKITSISSNIIPVNGSLRVILDYTDDGQHPIDTIFMHKIRLNQHQVPTVRDTLYILPASYPGSSKGQLQLDLDYTNFLISASEAPSSGNPPQYESDTLLIKFAARDNANNKSDTVSTPNIIVFRTN